jgi:hypothetical protein
MELLLDLGTGALAGLTFIAAVMIAGRVLGARDPARRDSGFWSSLLRISRSLHPVVAAGVLALCVAAFAVLGALVLVAEVPLEAFRVNVERRVPTLFSGILLLAAGAMALLAGRLALGGRSWAWLCLGVGLIAFGFDEVAELHERFEARTDLPTVIIFAPLALPLLVAWLRTVPALSAHPPALALFVLGGLAGVASQALDPIHNVWKSVLEETLEMTGGAMFVLALLLVLRPPDAVAEWTADPAEPADALDTETRA